jgi:hypothetical protein
MDLWTTSGLALAQLGRTANGAKPADPSTVVHKGFDIRPDRPQAVDNGDRFAESSALCAARDVKLWVESGRSTKPRLSPAY